MPHDALPICPVPPCKPLAAIMTIFSGARHGGAYLFSRGKATRPAAAEQIPNWSFPSKVPCAGGQALFFFFKDFSFPLIKKTRVA